MSDLWAMVSRGRCGRRWTSLTVLITLLAGGLAFGGRLEPAAAVSPPSPSTVSAALLPNGQISVVWASIAGASSYDIGWTSANGVSPSLSTIVNQPASPNTCKIKTTPTEKRALEWTLLKSIIDLKLEPDHACFNARNYFFSVAFSSFLSVFGFAAYLSLMIFTTSFVMS